MAYNRTVLKEMVGKFPVHYITCFKCYALLFTEENFVEHMMSNR